ncbi:MAG: hypothetical protein MJ102_00725 [Clostridia bacterium]|nr:hypothetical protein [Clostridia bacterium]
MEKKSHQFYELQNKCCALIIAFFLILPLLAASVIIAEAAGIENLYSFKKTYCGVLKSSGEILFNHRYHTSAFISVSEGDKLTFGPCYPDQTLYLTAYTASKSVTKQTVSASELTLKEKYSDGTLILQYTVPSGTAYVRITCRAEVYNTFVITKNNSFSFSEYKTYISENGLSEYAEWREKLVGSLAGKSLLWCGDSIGVGYYEHLYPGTSGSGCISKNRDTGDHPAWAKRIADMYGMSFKNTSRGGASLSTKRENVTNIYSQLSQNASSAYDYVFIEGGSVDVGGSNGIKVPLGKLSDSYSLSSFDSETTFIGALERCFYYATSKAPSSHIAFVIAYSMPRHPNNSNAWNEYWQYVPYVCEKWGISCIDLYNNEYVNKLFDGNRTPDGNSETAYYYDSLHISPMGYSITSVEIAIELASVPVYSSSLRHTPENIPEELKTGKSPETTPASPSQDITPLSEIKNLFIPSTVYKGRMQSDGKETSDPNKYFTTDFISVTPGSTLYYASANPSQGYQLIGFNTSGKAVTGWVKGTNMIARGTLSNGKVIFSYQIPSNVSKIRITFPVGTDPLITLDQPFDTSVYTQYLKHEPISVTTEEETTTLSPSSDTVTSPETTDYSKESITDTEISDSVSEKEGTITAEVTPDTSAEVTEYPGDSSPETTSTVEPSADSSEDTFTPVQSDTDTATETNNQSQETTNSDSGCGSLSYSVISIMIITLSAFFLNLKKILKSDPERKF